MRYPDTNQIIKELEAVNFTHEQGEKIIKAMHEINDAHYLGLATSFELEKVKLELKKEISDFKYSMLVWLIVSQVSATITILTVLQFAGKLF